MKKLTSITTLLCMWVLSTSVGASLIPTEIDFKAYITPGNPWVVDVDTYKYGIPAWNADFTKLTVNNIFVKENIKTVWLEIDFVNQAARGLAYLLPVFNIDPITGAVIEGGWPKIDVATSATIVNWEWTINPQPALEVLDLSNSIWNLQTMAGIKSITVATRCVVAPIPVPVPVPGSFWLLGSGCVGLLFPPRKLRQ